LDRASGYEPGGRTFESCRAHHTYQQFTPSRTVGASSTVPDFVPTLANSRVMRDPTAVLVDVSRLGVWGALKASRAARYRRATRTAATCGPDASDRLSSSSLRGADQVERDLQGAVWGGCAALKPTAGTCAELGCG
jgi:hypothetical protein